MANDLINYAYSGEAQKDRVGRASRLVNRWRFQENGVLREGIEVQSPFLHTLPYASLPSDCS